MLSLILRADTLKYLFNQVECKVIAFYTTAAERLESHYSTTRVLKADAIRCEFLRMSIRQVAATASRGLVVNSLNAS